jgi:hypothetical protein
MRDGGVRGCSQLAVGNGQNNKLVGRCRCLYSTSLLLALKYKAPALYEKTSERPETLVHNIYGDLSNTTYIIFLIHLLRAGLT